MNNIFEIAKRINIDEKFVIPFGNDKAKISLDILETLKDRPTQACLGDGNYSNQSW